MADLGHILQRTIECNSKSLISKMFLKFVIAVGSSLGFVWLIIGLVNWIFDWKPLANTGLLGGIVVVSVCTLASSVFVLIHLYKHTVKLQARMPELVPVEELPEDRQLTDTLTADLQAAYREEKWEEVLKIGSVLSRPLWVTGKYRLRVEIGKLVEAAAAYSHHHR